MELLTARVLLLYEMPIKHLTNQEITLYSRASYDKFGRKVVGEGVNYNARVEKCSDERLLPNGQVVTIELKVFLDGDVTVNIDDRVDYSSISYKVFKVKNQVGRLGKVHHTYLELTKWLN